MQITEKLATLTLNYCQISLKFYHILPFLACGKLLQSQGAIGLIFGLQLASANYELKTVKFNERHEIILLSARFFLGLKLRNN